jgi:hypothetical protein
MRCKTQRFVDRDCPSALPSVDIAPNTRSAQAVKPTTIKMSHKLPRTLQAAPNTLHARLEVADAIRTLFPTELRKAGFNPDEPRVPAGDSNGGQWTKDGGSRSWIHSLADWFRHTSDPEWAEAQNVQDLVENHPRAAIISGGIGLAIPLAPAAAFALPELLGAGATAEGPALHFCLRRGSRTLKAIRCAFVER